MKGNVYWMEGRTFIVGAVGRKYLTGIVIEADGLHTARVPVTERLAPVLLRGQPYPARKVRGHLRRMAAVTKEATRLRKELLTEAAP